MGRTALVLIGTLALGMASVGVPDAGAQAVEGFATGNLHRDVNEQPFGGAGGGVLVHLGRWVAVGGEGDLFISIPYFAGRGTLFGQANLRPGTTVRPIVIGGISGGEESGPMLGGGVEIRPSRRRVGLRATVQDHLARLSGIDCAYFGIDRPTCDAQFHGGRPWTGHQLTFSVGIVWR